MVSFSQSAVSMVDGFTITAYNSKEPSIKYENGVVSSENVNAPLAEGAYVIFTYGDDESKLYNVEFVKVVGGIATSEAAKTAKSVVAYLGTSATNVATNAVINAPLSEEMIVTEETVEEVAEETTKETVEEVVEETTEETEEAVAEEVAE